MKQRSQFITVTQSVDPFGNTVVVYMCPKCLCSLTSHIEDIGNVDSCLSCGHNYIVPSPTFTFVPKDSNLIKCPDCKSSISKLSTMCIKCGRPFNPDISQHILQRLFSKKKYIFVLLLTISAIGVAFLYKKELHGISYILSGKKDISKYISETNGNLTLLVQTYSSLPKTPRISINQKIDNLSKILSDQKRLESISVPEIQQAVVRGMYNLISAAEDFQRNFDRPTEALSSINQGIKDLDLERTLDLIKKYDKN